MLLHPRFELLAKHSSANVNNPLLWDLRQVNLVRQVLIDSWLDTYKVHDLLERKVLVLWHMESLYVIDMQVGLPSRQDILEEVNGCVICVKEKKLLDFECKLKLKNVYSPYGGR